MIQPKYNKSAFTLVELIVVIVILAILATIAFLSFGSQSSSARDSARLSDLTNISKGLGVYNATAGKYLMPDDPINITNSGTANIIGYQGYAGDAVLNSIKASPDGFKDPLDKERYTYLTNKKLSTFQILGFLENKDSVALNIFGNLNSASAFDYISRYTYVQGTGMGVIIRTSGTTMTPAQDGKVAIDVATTAADTTIVAVTGNNNTPTAVTPALAQAFDPSKYSGCDIQDITIIGTGGVVQTWAACNVGATTTSGWDSIPLMLESENNMHGIPSSFNKSVQGDIFQFGRNTPVTFGNETTTKLQALNSTSNSFIIGVEMCENGDNWCANSAFWMDHFEPDAWGGSGTVGIDGGYEDPLKIGYNESSDASKTKMAGPCAAGYHVPTVYEWKIALDAYSGNPKGFIKDLKLPFGGDRGSDGVYQGQGGSCRYWTSSTYFDNDAPLDENIYDNFSTIGINKDNVGFDNTGYGNRGLFVRCLKN